MKIPIKVFSICSILAAVFGLFLVVAIYHTGLNLPEVVVSAQAAETGHGGGHGGSSHAGGHGGGSSHVGGHEEEPGGHEEEMDSHLPGPKGFGGQGVHGGRYGVEMEEHSPALSVENNVFRGHPVWAQEGIPEVELGRLNVSRAPAFVLGRAEAEALVRFTPQMASLYDMSATEAANMLQTHFEQVSRLDSPLQNLALYRDIMVYGKSQLPGVHPASKLDLAAIFLGSAADKNIEITDDTVMAVNKLLGLVELDPGTRSILASKANTVREAIYIGHSSEGE